MLVAALLHLVLLQLLFFSVFDLSAGYCALALH